LHPHSSIRYRYSSRQVDYRRYRYSSTIFLEWASTSTRARYVLAYTGSRARSSNLLVIMRLLTSPFLCVDSPRLGDPHISPFAFVFVFNRCVFLCLCWRTSFQILALAVEVPYRHGSHLRYVGFAMCALAGAEILCSKISYR